MRRKKRSPETGTICKTITVLMAIWFMAPNTAFSQSVGAYGIEYYREAGPEPMPRWQNDLPGVYQKLQNFLTAMDNLGATTSNSHFGSNVSRSNIQAKYTTGFDRYNMVYWQAHTHTLPFNKSKEKKEDWWEHDPDNLLNWGTGPNPYLPGQANYWNPSWFQYPCAQNAGPGYTAAGNTDWKTTSLPMWNGYYGRHQGEAVLTKCDLSRYNGNGLGQNNNNWMIMDSCDAVRVAHHTTYDYMDHGVISWDQTFDGMHGVYGHYASIVVDEDKADDFAEYLNDGLTIWEAYQQASKNHYSIHNKKASVITAENKQRIPYYFGGKIVWGYPYWDQMAITDHWYGYGNVSNDIAAQDIEYFYTTYYVPN